MKLQLILNGKSAADPLVRKAVESVRSDGVEVAVRVTWEAGDAQRFASEACREGPERIVAAGGDGTLHEVVNGWMAGSEEDRAETARPDLALLPLGTANDFAASCAIPTDPLPALRLAAGGTAVPVDVAVANRRFFLNVASGGVGAAATASAPAEMKRFLGTGAYSLMGAVMALSYRSYESQLTLPGSQQKVSTLIAAVCNGRQAGGGQVLAPRAVIDDGLLDVLLIRPFAITDVGQVFQELTDLSQEGEFVSYHQVPWLEAETSEPVPINLDGEPTSGRSVRFEVRHRALPLVVPPDCPLLFEPSLKDAEPSR